MAPLATQEQGSTLLTPYDLHLFNEGKHNRLYEKFGAHVVDSTASAAPTSRCGLPMPNASRWSATSTAGIPILIR